MTVVMPAMAQAQEAGWLALLEISQRMPSGWTLVGGQLVHLHCVERGSSPPRPTSDLDAVLDVRQEPHALALFTAALLDIGFEGVGVSPNGYQHRFHRGEAQIDVLIPRHLGERGENRQGVTGSPTIPAPGSQQALDRTEPVQVEIAGHVGAVLRPNLLGALVGKAATRQILVDPGRDRHVEDFAVLASLLTSADLREEMTKLDVKYLANMVGHVVALGFDTQVEGARRGINMLRSFLRQRQGSTF